MSEIIEHKPGNGTLAVHDDSPHEFLLRAASTANMDAAKLDAMTNAIIKLQQERRADEEQRRAWAEADRKEAARVIFFEAKAKMQKQLKVMEKTVPNARFGTAKFVDYGDMWEANCGTWTEFGFSVSFQTAITNGFIHTELWLDHASGHREVYTTPEARPGMSGSKDTTSVQDNQATITYLQRGLLSRALGIAMKGEDKDGNPPDNPHVPHGAPVGKRPVQQTPTIDKSQQPPGEPVAEASLTNPWALDVERRLKSGGKDWWRLLIKAYIDCPVSEDLEALADLTRDNVATLTPDVRTEIGAALMGARKRLHAQKTAVQQAPDVGRHEETIPESKWDWVDPDGVVQPDAVRWAMSFVEFWRITPAFETAELLDTFKDTLAEARKSREAAMLLAVLDEEDESTTPDSGDSDESETLEDVLPPQTEDETWASNIKTSLDSMPTTPEGRKQYNLLTGLPDIQEKMRQLKKDAPDIYQSVRAHFAKTSARLPK